MTKRTNTVDSTSRIGLCRMTSVAAANRACAALGLGHPVFANDYWTDDQDPEKDRPVGKICGLTADDDRWPAIEAATASLVVWRDRASYRATGQRRQAVVRHAKAKTGIRMAKTVVEAVKR